MVDRRQKGTDFATGHKHALKPIFHSLLLSAVQHMNRKQTLDCNFDNTIKKTAYHAIYNIKGDTE